MDNYITLPAEIWTKILSYPFHFESMLSASCVCRDFYNILYPKLSTSYRHREVAVWTYNCSLTYFYETYLKQYYCGHQDRQHSLSYKEDFWQVESKRYSIKDTELVLNMLHERAYNIVYPLSLKFDTCLLFTHNILEHVQRWGFDWNMLRTCLLMNAPIIIAIPTDTDNLITEQSFKEQVSVVQKYIKDVDARNISVTVIPFVRDIAPEEFKSYVPWYNGPDLATALSMVDKTDFKTFKSRMFLVTKPISETRCVGMLRHGTLTVNGKVDTLRGSKTIKSMKVNGVPLDRAYPGVEIELELDTPSTYPNPSLKKFGLIGLGVKSVKAVYAKVFINRKFNEKGTRNGLITWIHFLGGKAKCKIEVEKMLECSKRQYDLKRNVNFEEKYHWSTYSFLRKTLDRGVLGLVKLTPRDEQLPYVMTLNESSDLSRFYVTENSEWIGLGVVLEKVYD